MTWWMRHGEVIATQDAVIHAARGLGQRDRDTGDLVDFVQDLKSQPGGDIGIHASISVTQALLAAGVVDELGVVIAPRIVGTGKRLLDGLPPIQLEMIRTERSPNGHLLAAHRVTH